MKTECATPAPAIQIDKESVRMLAIEIGVRPAARKLGLNEDRVCQWSKRGNWFPALPDIQQANVSTVSKPGDVLLRELQTHERETRLSLARSARKLATEAESANLGQSGNVLNVGKLAGIVHKWGDEKQNVQFSLNVLNLNMLSDSEPDSIDV